MKIGVKYARFAAMIAPWVWTYYSFFPTNTFHGKVRFFFPLFINLSQVLPLLVKRLPEGVRSKLSGALAGGMWISLGCAVVACLVYLTLYLVMDQRLTESWPAVQTSDRIESYVLLGNLAKLFIIVMLGGLIYSTAVLFVTRQRQKA